MIGHDLYFSEHDDEGLDDWEFYDDLLLEDDVGAITHQGDDLPGRVEFDPTFHDMERFWLF